MLGEQLGTGVLLLRDVGEGRRWVGRLWGGQGQGPQALSLRVAGDWVAAGQAGRSVLPPLGGRIPPPFHSG